ncbi:MAG: hypothetical protein ABR540_04660 [Acidimicrobiales bacterium]
MELRSPIEGADVFAAGCDEQCVIEASADGSAWTPLSGARSEPAGLRQDPLFVATASGEPVRFVRVSRPAGLDRVTELSVWPASPPPAKPRAGDGRSRSAPTPGGLTGRRQSRGADGDDLRGKQSAAGVAILALAAAGGGLLAVTARRRFSG